MNFSSKTKNEILKNDVSKRCCQIALLSGFIRAGGSAIVRGGHIGFSVSGEEKVLNFIAKIVKSVYGINLEITADELNAKRCNCQVASKESTLLMLDTKIVTLSDDGVGINLNIDYMFEEKDCCKRSFIIGAFLGSGTVTIPDLKNSKSTSYHFEIVFSGEDTARQFCELFSSLGFMPKMISRKETQVVYLNSAEAVNDALTFVGAINASLELTDVIMKREIKNNLNRSQNCEMNNLNKLIDASIMDREAIQVIDKILGLDSLSEALQIVARARLDNPEGSLAEISENLGISKSCLSHRIRKLREIAKNLQN